MSTGTGKELFRSAVRQVHDDDIRSDLFNILITDFPAFVTAEKRFPFRSSRHDHLTVQPVHSSNSKSAIFPSFLQSRRLITSLHFSSENSIFPPLPFSFSVTGYAKRAETFRSRPFLLYIWFISSFFVFMPSDNFSSPSARSFPVLTPAPGKYAMILRHLHLCLSFKKAQGNDLVFPFVQAFIASLKERLSTQASSRFFLSLIWSIT